jgi:hypothetical protein
MTKCGFDVEWRVKIGIGTFLLTVCNLLVSQVLA